MKKNILFYILIITSTLSSAQDTIRPIKLGVAINYINEGQDIINAINPSAIVYYKKHSAFIGALIIPTYSEIDQYFSSISPLYGYSNLNLQTKYSLGLQMGYKIYPNKKGKVFNFFFDYNLSFLKSKINYSINNLYSSTHDNIKLNLEIFDFYNFIGYGFDVNFLKHFYLTTNFGIGLGWNHYESNPSYLIGGMFMSSESYVLEPSAIIKIGLGYNFLSLKK